jgi:solute:Na+ symporter, SSS family
MIGVGGSVSIGNLDLAVIVVYLVGIVGLGCWAGMRQRRGAGETDYFLAGKTLTWPIIGAALFSTNISTIHLVSLAQEGYVNGLAYGNFEWMAAFTLIALALFFAPFYIRANVSTLPDFLEKRYSRPCRDWLAVLSIISAIFIHIGFSLYTGAVVLKGLFGIELMTSIIWISLLTGVYTIVGGLLAVVLTESIQTIVLLAGSIVITLVGLHHVGGWSGLTASVDPVKLTVLRPASDPCNLPWYAVFLGYPVIGLWYWCADQTIVQRVLGAKDENHARVGPLFAGFIKILPVFIFVLPGTICLGLVHQGRLPSDLKDSADTYAFLINHLLPAGGRGLAAAALLAALMSTVSGALNSIATLFSYDLYKRWRPQVSDRSVVRVGRIVTFVAMVAAIAWSPACAHYSSIFQGVQTVVCYIAPPITAVFLWGVFWRGANAAGAIVTLWTGSGLGLAVFLLDWCKDRPWFKAHVGWNLSPMMGAFYLFVLCSALLVLVSTATRRPLNAEQAQLVWANPLAALRGPAWPGLGNYRVLSAVLFAVMVALYVVFK